MNSENNNPPSVEADRAKSTSLKSGAPKNPLVNGLIFVAFIFVVLAIISFTNWDYLELTRFS